MDINRAIAEGIDSARCFRKEGESPYHMKHPLFRIWWEAVVRKADTPSLSDEEIKAQVVAKFMRKRK